MRTFLLLAVTAGLCLSQPPDFKSPSGHARALQAQVKGVVIKSAEKMPAEDYGFRPTPEIRSYAELIAHVADANYAFCSASLVEKNPDLKIEAGVKKDPAAKPKAALVEALAASFAYCDKAYAALTDVNSTEAVKFFGGERARIGVLSFNTSHTFEHYGNIVTYLRMKKIVPPSSERSN